MGDDVLRNIVLLGIVAGLAATYMSGSKKYARNAAIGGAAPVALLMLRSQMKANTQSQVDL